MPSFGRLLAGGFAALLLAVLFSPQAGAQTPAPKPETTITWKGAPEFKSGDFTFKPRGRVFLDYVHQEVEGGFALGDLTANNTRLRTARLGVEGAFDRRFAYVAEVSVAGGEARWEDLLLEYRAGERTAFSVGNFKVNSLENLTSSRFITFMERGPFNEVLGLGRTLNLAFLTHGERWSVSGALSGDNINDVDVAGDESHAVSARATAAPLVAENRALHLGVWARRRVRGDEDGFRYAARANTNFGQRFIDTRAFGASDTTLGLEAALVAGPVSLQGEYARSSAEAVAPVDDDADFDTFYVFGSWFITGESRTYDPEEGVFRREKVRRPVTSGGPGAVELAVRYEHADLSDAFNFRRNGPAQAGEYQSVTVGANWRPISYVRFMANFTSARTDNPAGGLDADIQTFQTRAQFDF